MLPLPKYRPEVQFTSPGRRAYQRAKKVLAVSEAAEMRQEHRATRLNSPPWAMSDQKLQRVVAELMWRSAVIRVDKPFPTDTFESNRMAFVRALDARVQARTYKPLNSDGEQQIRERASTIAHNKFGRSSLLLAILYLAYRNGMRSPAVAATVCGGDGSVSPPFVRQILGRANMIARSLWPDDCYELHHLANRKQYMKHLDKLCTRRLRKSPLPTGCELNRLYEAGEQPQAMAKQFSIQTWQIVKLINQHRELCGSPTINPKTFRVVICSPKPVPYAIENLFALWEAGKTVEEIKQLTGKRTMWIRFYLLRFGVDGVEFWQRRGL